jgi:pimeloyl-ACP methyl ester carboxylesterase
VVDTITFCSMLYNGFHFHRTSLTCFVELFPFRPLTLVSTYESPAKHLTYWHRPHTSKTRLPILFIHGIGIGLYPYTNFLRELNTEDEEFDGDVGIIALEIMPISSRITHSALEKDVMVHEIQTIIKYHGWTKYVLVSHSYGSIISTHLLKSPLTSPAIGNIMLIDPVSFLLHLPDVAYNFTARQPVHANEHLLWYFGSKDIGVAHTLARRFFWSENIIWKEDLRLAVEQWGEGRKVTVAFGGKDILVDTNTVGRYLMDASSKELQTGDQAMRVASEVKVAAVSGLGGAVGEDWKTRPWVGSGLEVLWFEQMDHGQVFELEKTRRPIIKAIGVYTQLKGTSLL